MCVVGLAAVCSFLRMCVCLGVCMLWLWLLVGRERESFWCMYRVTSQSIIHPGVVRTPQRKSHVYNRACSPLKRAET